MKRLLALALLLIALDSGAQRKVRNVRQELMWLKKSLLQNHVEPRNIDDTFSADVFDKFLDEIDPDRIFLTKADITALEIFRHLIDDDLNGRDTGFLKRFQERYRSGLARSEGLIRSVLAAPLDWKNADVYEPEPQWVSNEAALADRHRQWLKYLILERMVELMDRDSSSTPDFFDRNISAATSYARTISLEPVTQRMKDPDAFEHEVTDAFLQAIASVFDPHSTFFSTRDYDEFVTALSTEDYYFGFTLGEDGKGRVIISALAPGGPAWKSGALHVSDVLLALRWSDSGVVDLRGMNIDDVNGLLRGNDRDELELTVRTVEGQERKVSLRKEKLESEENVVQSFILEADVRLGYIYLPDFYTRWGDQQEGGRCANDVAKEIIKLKREGIEGLIIDLRFNGGGSLYEATAMAGIFIEEGPLAVQSTRQRKGATLKDMNRGTVYDGPLALMVNGSSASASEVLAAAIQDYNRGLIVGSRTYGKATGQNIFPIEGVPASSGTPDLKSSVGYVKVTTQRLYRVTGKSAQGRGVTPDIAIPDIFRVLEVRESEYPFAMKPDSIPMNIYYKPLKPINRAELQARSRQRLAENPTFQELEKTVVWLEDKLRATPKPESLLWERYLAESREVERYEAGLNVSVQNPAKVFEVRNGAAKDQRLAVDDYARQLNERWKKSLTADFYLQETYHILRDQIALNKNP